MSPSGFYAWRTRPESTRAQEDRRLKVLVHALVHGGRGYYGSPRIYDDFVEWQEPVSRKRIIRLMQEEGLKARVRKRYKGTTMSDHDQPVADNLLQQEFTAERPNQRWVGDTSELRIGENGKVYLAVDPRSVLAVRRGVGGQCRQRSPSDHQSPRHGREAPLPGHRPAPSLRSRLARTPARTTRRVLEAHGIICSMSRRGNCYDNAVMEAFFSTVKSEVGERFDSHGDAKRPVVRLHRSVL